jgi:hypothetical protein
VIWLEVDVTSNVEAVSVAHSPTPDRGGLASPGTTPFVRSFAEASLPVTFTAPASASGHAFVGWRDDTEILSAAGALALDTPGTFNIRALYSSTTLAATRSSSHSAFERVTKPYEGGEDYTRDDLGLVYPTSLNALLAQELSPVSSSLKPFTESYWAQGVGTGIHWIRSEQSIRVSGYAVGALAGQTLYSITMDVGLGSYWGAYLPGARLCCLTSATDSLDMTVADFVALPGTDISGAGKHTLVLSTPLVLNTWLFVGMYLTNWEPPIGMRWTPDWVTKCGMVTSNITLEL